MENQQIEIRNILIMISAALDSLRQRLPPDKDSYELIDRIEEIQVRSAMLSQGE